MTWRYWAALNSDQYDSDCLNNIIAANDGVIISSSDNVTMVESASLYLTGARWL